MTIDLKERLLNEDVRPKLVMDCCTLIDQQVSAKRGFSGIAIKGAYKAIKAIKRGFVSGVVDALLDEWVDKLVVFHGEYVAAGSPGTLSEYLSANKARVALALIEVTDQRAETTKHKTAKKFYKRLRPSAITNVEGAVPDLARLVEAHAAGQTDLAAEAV